MVWHQITENKRQALPGHIVVLYAETKQDYNVTSGTTHTLDVASIQYYRIEGDLLSRYDCMCTTDSMDLWHWVYTKMHPRRPLWLFAWDLAKTLSVCKLWNEIEDGNLKLHDRRDHSPARLLQPSPLPTSGCLFVDSPACEVVKLEDHCTAKLLCVGIGNWYECDPPKDVVAARDLVLDWMRFVRDERLGNFRFSLAGQAMSAYRHIAIPLLRKKRLAPVVHDNIAARRLERASYYGGRFAAFYIGKCDTTIYQLDVNGLYPYVMQAYPYPRYLCKPRKLPHEMSPLDPAVACRMIADVEVHSPTREYPIRQDHRVIYATGYYRTVLAGPELADAAERHAINQIYSYTIYHLAPIFTEFMQDMWSRRQRFQAVGQTQQAKWIKRLMNALYGKFGQRLPMWRPKIYETPPTPWSSWSCVYSDTGRVTTKRAIGWDVEESTDRLEHPDAMPMIAAFVTSYARIYMDRLRCIAGLSHVYYQAADCLFVDVAGLENLDQSGCVSGTALGKLRLVAEYPSSEWHGVQHYRVGDQWVRGPIQQDAMSVGDNTYVQPASEHLPSVVTRQPDGTHHVHSIVARLYGCGPSGVVGPDGWIRPYHLTSMPSSDPPVADSIAASSTTI